MKIRMDEAQIHDSDLAERYVTGRLQNEEQVDFEAHFVDCPQCLDRIEAAQGLRRGMSALGPQDEQRRAGVRVLQVWRAPAFALAASIILLLMIAVGAALREANRAKNALDAERIAAAGLQQRLGEAQTALRHEQDSRSALEKELSRNRQPQLQVPVFALIATRGEQSETLQLPRASQWILISMERESPPRFDRYRVTLFGSDRKQLWEEEARPTSRETLAIGLHSSLLPPGEYVFQLQGISKSGGPSALARHRIQVVPAPEPAGAPRR